MMVMTSSPASTLEPTLAGPRACIHCDGTAHPEGPPAVLTGTGMVELQMYRCERTPSHWWHQDRVLV